MTPAALPMRQSAPPVTLGGGFTGQNPAPLEETPLQCKALPDPAPAPQGAGWVPKAKARCVLPTLTLLPCHPPGTQSTGLTCPGTIPAQMLRLAPCTAAQGRGRAQPPPGQQPALSFRRSQTSCIDLDAIHFGLGHAVTALKCFLHHCHVLRVCSKYFIHFPLPAR